MSGLATGTRAARRRRQADRLEVLERTCSALRRRVGELEKAADRSVVTRLELTRHIAELEAGVAGLELELIATANARDTWRQSALDLDRLGDTQRAELERIGTDRARLQGWLARIEGGDNPTEDATTLRRWAYQGGTLGHELPVG